MLQNDNLPQKICIQCYEIVKQAKHLRLLATANDTALRSLLSDVYQENTVINTPDPTLNLTGGTPELVINKNSSNEDRSIPSQNEKEIKSIERESRKRKIGSNKINIKELVNDENVSIGNLIFFLILTSNQLREQRVSNLS